MRSSQFFLKGALAATLVAAVSVSYATHDGHIGFDSKGAVDITLKVSQRIRVSGLDDIDIVRGKHDQKFVYGYTKVCVASESDGKYHITASSSNKSDANNYYLAPSGGNGDKNIPYTIFYTERNPPGDSMNESDVSRLGNDDSLNNSSGNLKEFKLQPTTNQNYDCLGKYNGTLWVKVKDADIASVMGGSNNTATDTYQDTVTVTVTAA